MTAVDELLETWEDVSVDSGITTVRMRVPGGWLVHTVHASGTDLMFFQDDQWSWNPVPVPT